METISFDTALGRFGLGWTKIGIARLQLPGLDDGAMELRINRDGARPGVPTALIQNVITQIQAYAEGGFVDFAGTPIDLCTVPEFHRRAYALLLGIGWGQTTTYGTMARQLGNVQLSRAVGQAMGANPVPLIIPCHRVLASGGRAGGFSAPGGASAKARMLTLEGAPIGTPRNQMTFGF